MIGVRFQYGSENIDVGISNSNVFFRTSSSPQFATIEGLRLDKKGVEKEFPDLKDNENWRLEAIKRFKEKIKSFENENKQIQYIIDDLSKFGYIPLYLLKDGYRPIKLKK